MDGLGEKSPKEPAAMEKEEGEPWGMITFGIEEGLLELFTVPWERGVKTEGTWPTVFQFI